MTAKLLMNPSPLTVQSNDTIARGAQKIMTKQRRSLPVVDDEGRFLGMLTADCLLYLCLPKAATMERGLDGVAYIQESLQDLGERLNRYMNEPVTLCLKQRDRSVVHPNTPLVETLLRLYETKDNLSVVDKETECLVGMISYYDVGEKILEVLPDGPVTT